MLQPAVPSTAARPRAARPASAPRPELTALLASAAQADERAWDCLVRRFGATIDRVTRRHGLGPAAADDVAQLTWLALLEHIYAVRDAEALGGWIATTARRACLEVQHGATREVLVDEPREVADRTTVEQQVEAAEREVVLRHALEVLNPRERRLVELLLADPEVSYRQIGAALGMPIGSIGPTRQRCFGRLRRVPQLAALAQAA
ncbi:MAG: hypothetical protein QOG11_1903 [Solirubrobacteraceae bacterium]|nr:hypothetical protein [Solirubrobacteraceae bacterium]